MESLLQQTKTSKDSCSGDLAHISRISFPHFYFGIFALGVFRVEGIFEFGKHLLEWCYRLQKYPKTATVSARYHIKSGTALGKIAWHLYRMDAEGAYNEWNLMGYTEDLAGHQLRRLKRYISAIPEYFDDCVSLTNAETILHYTKNGCEFICEPLGVLVFKRGLHPDGIICDDILKDPEVKLDISQLLKIEKIFKEEIMSMPKKELHVFGTPQDEADLFSFLESTPSFNAKRYPAEIDRTNEIALWPEVWSWQRLKERENEIREKAYNKEFLCSPARSEDGYFTSREIDSIICRRLKNFSHRKVARIRGYCYGGYDLGKKRHPSHISILAEDRKARLIQIASIWLDGEDYTKQLDICKWLIENYRFMRFNYDNTRAELEGFKERGELPAEMRGVTFTQKEKFEIAATFEQAVKAEAILLLPDERQKRQILNVDNDLKSMETDEGHGDSFWSNALAVAAARGKKPNLRLV